MREHGRHAEIVELQHLRALAVMMVVLAHIHQSDARFMPSALFGQAAFFGFAGVDVFFVLSGFIIHWLYRDHSGLDLPYFLNRLNRILPLYWIFTGLALLGHMVLGDSLNRGIGDLDIVASLTLIPTGDLPLLMVGWTLTHELYFYAAYGLALLLPKPARAWAAAGWAIATLAWNLWPQHPPSPWLALAFSPFNLLFLGGIAIAQFRAWLHGLRWPALALAAAGLALGLYWTDRHGLDGLTDPVARVAVFAPFAVGIAAAGLAWSLRLPRFWARIGDWSYAIYLSHLLVIGVLARLAGKAFDMPFWSSVLLYGAAVAATLVFGALTHTLVEHPLLRLGKAGIRRALPPSAKSSRSGRPQP